MWPEHSSAQYDLDLEAIRSQVLLMGGLLEQQFRDAIRALLSGNVELAEKVIRTDDEINELDKGLDSACTQLILKRQPVAGDLRAIMATTKVVIDLERIGDEIIKVGQSATKLQNQNALISSNYEAFQVIADNAGRMLHAALDAYARMDRDLAIKLIAMDAVVDHEYHEMKRRLIAFMMDQPQTVPAAFEVISAAKSIERVADHSTNIAEYVINMIEGKDIRHANFEALYPERPV